MKQLLSKCIPNVEKRVVRQLLEAMLFERLIDYTEIKSFPNTIFILKGKERTYRCEGKRTSFDRIRLQENSIVKHIDDRTTVEAVSIEELVEEIVDEPSEKGRLLTELKQTILFSDWNERNSIQPLSRRKSSYEELESEILEGHPYHPCFKSRTGFTIADHENYSPETKAAFPLKWLAVRRNNVQLSILDPEEEFWQRELGSLLWNLLLEQLRKKGGTFEDYTFMPIHPWQLNNLKAELATYFAAEDLILLEASGDQYRATQSVRTLWNATNPDKANVKLAMNLVNTSSLRILQQEMVCSAPHLSKWLQQIIVSDDYLMNEARLIALAEYGGAIWQPNAAKHLEGQIGVIWRESLQQYLSEKEQAAPFTALLVVEKDGRPFIGEWIQQFGLENWLSRFLEVSVLPVWHLLIRHGIAVEAHAQNMILLHEDGWPSRVALRDFHESLEYNRDFLADASLEPNFGEVHRAFQNAADDSYFWMSSVEALRELAMDTLFIFHLSELAHLLESYYEFPESDFWQLVGKQIALHLERYPDLMNRHERLNFKKPSIFTESLLTKKIKNKTSENFRHTVTNVFSK